MKKLEKTLRESNPLASDSQVPVTDVSIEEDDDGLAQGSDGEARKIDVSGGNISLVVDFSSSLTGFSSDNNVFESTNGSCPNENENQTQECLVGNLVWAMNNKSKKWWPGEVVGFKADDAFMVRYLGQRQFVSWCAPSKLKPFKENFEEMVNQREDVGFFVAVEKAMTLLGNSLKLEMTCSCIAERNGVVMPAALKAKPLILREFSVDGMDAKEFVSQVKNLGECVSSAGILELTVMQSRLSAFYSFCGHKQIPMDQLQGKEVRQSKMKDDGQFVGCPSVVAGSSSRRRFRKEWFRKFVSEVDNASVKDDLANTSPSDLVSKLKLLAVDYKCSEEEMENMSLFEWFFSKFRISVFHDENAYKMQLANMAGLEDLMVDKDANRGTDHKISKSKSKIKRFSGGVSVTDDTEQRTFESQESNMETLNVVSTEHKSSKPALKKIKHTISCVEPFAKESSVQSLKGKTCMTETLSRPAATYVLDLNSGCNPDHLQEPETSIPPKVLPQQEERPNFQVAAQCSNYGGVSGEGIVSSQPASERNFTNVTSLEKKKRGKKRKKADDPIVAHATSAIPDLNGIATEPQAETIKRRIRGKKGELPNGLTREITILLLKFSSKVSMPSRDDLTSTFSAFGPLDASETHVSEEFSGAQVAFVSSGDAIEAVKSLERADPFGDETLVSFRLQQKLISVQRNIAPRMPVISHVVSPSPKLNNTQTSVDSMKQNLLMMTAMLEKSGDRLSRETKTKLKSEVIELLDKVSSMPSSSSSSD